MFERLNARTNKEGYNRGLLRVICIHQANIEINFIHICGNWKDHK